MPEKWYGVPCAKSHQFELNPFSMYLYAFNNILDSDGTASEARDLEDDYEEEIAPTTRRSVFRGWYRMLE